MRRFQADLWGHACIEGFLPARHAQAPAVARLQAREIPLGGRSHEVIALSPGEEQKLLSHLNANGMQAHIARSGTAVAIPVKSRHGLSATALKILAENVGGHIRG